MTTPCPPKAQSPKPAQTRRRDGWASLQGGETVVNHQNEQLSSSLSCVWRLRLPLCASLFPPPHVPTSTVDTCTPLPPSNAPPRGRRVAAAVATRAAITVGQPALPRSAPPAHAGTATRDTRAALTVWQRACGCRHARGHAHAGRRCRRRAAAATPGRRAGGRLVPGRPHFVGRVHGRGLHQGAGHAAGAQAAGQRPRRAR